MLIDGIRGGDFVAHTPNAPLIWDISNKSVYESVFGYVRRKQHKTKQSELAEGKAYKKPPQHKARIYGEIYNATHFYVHPRSK